MNKKFIAQAFLIMFLIECLSFTTVYSQASGEDNWWNDSWSFRQKLEMPLDTSSPLTHGQPIDTRISFTQSCWAQDASARSVRVCCLKDETWYELDSQIYNLEKSDSNHITACSLVFLIPRLADGTEQYFVYYDDSETPSPQYDDHVDLKEDSYFFEPISGYPIESTYYKILQDGSVIYAVAQQGRFMGYDTSQHVTKMKDNITEVIPKNGDLIASFDFKFYYGEGEFDYDSTSQKLISKEVLVDGNLMTAFRIISRSNRENIQTTALYTYYFCPSETKRLHLEVTHEALDECRVGEEINTDGTYAALQSGGVKSRSIEELNVGRILPFMHLSAEDGSIKEYPLDPDPEYIPEEHDIRVLSNPDDVDLSSPPWISVDEGSQGVCHAIIFDSNKVLVSGTDERDGIQVNAYEVDYPHLPGLENNLAVTQMGRNSYEAGSTQDLLIPSDFKVVFHAEFYSTPTKGYSVVEQEAHIFQQLVSLKPTFHQGPTEPQHEGETHQLTVVVHQAPSFPYGAALSALLGRNLSYVTAELYKDDHFVCSATLQRLPLNPLPTLQGLTLREKLQALIHLFDWKNLTVFKTARFQGLESGSYIVKIFMKNPFFGSTQRYIGFSHLQLTQDDVLHVFCRPEGSLKVKVNDQYETPVNDATIILSCEGYPVGEGKTDETGMLTLTAPVNRNEDYLLSVLYQGFLIDEQQINLHRITPLHPQSLSIDLTRYGATVSVIDNWNLPIAVDLHPTLTSSTMSVPLTLRPTVSSEGQYVFSDLPPAEYVLSLIYKSYSLQQQLKIPDDDLISVQFPAEFPLTISLFNSRGDSINDGSLVITRSGISQTAEVTSSSLVESLPPGQYALQVVDGSTAIGARSIRLLGERTVDLVTTTEPVYPLVLIGGAILCLAIGLVFLLYKKSVSYFGYMITIALVLGALAFPWWQIQGATCDLEATTNMFIIPLRLVSMLKTEGIIAGEVPFLPDAFIIAMTFVPLLCALSCAILLAFMFIPRIYNWRWRRFLLLGAVLMLLGSLLVFTIGMSALTGVGVGSFIGEGSLDVDITGTDTVSVLHQQWGPTLGFYLVVLATINLFVLISKDIYLMVQHKRESPLRSS
jgi:hypothetical protein